MIRWRIDGVDAVVTDRWGGVSGGAYESLNLGLHVDDQWSRVAANRELVARAEAALDPYGDRAGNLRALARFVIHRRT